MRTEIFENAHGLSFEIEMLFVEKDQFGNPVNEDCVSERSFAKMYLYKDAKKLLPKKEEEKAIAEILQVGLTNLINSNFNA